MVDFDVIVGNNVGVVEYFENVYFFLNLFGNCGNEFWVLKLDFFDGYEMVRIKVYGGVDIVEGVIINIVVLLLVYGDVGCRRGEVSKGLVGFCVCF